MQFRTNRQRVEGLGTAHDGVGHWWSQRVTAIALVPLSSVLRLSLISPSAPTGTTVLAAYGRPLNASSRSCSSVGFRHLERACRW